MFLSLPVSVILLIVLVIGLFIFTIFIQHDYGKYMKLPPSLIRIPILGNIHYLVKYRLPPHIMFEKISEKLGPVFTFWFGDKPVIIINDYETAKYIMHQKLFAGRPQRHSGHVYSRGFQGLITTDYNENFKNRSTIVHKSLQNSKYSWEELFETESNHFIDSINHKLSSGKNELNITHELNLMSINTMWMMLFNKRLELHSKTYHDVDKMLKLLREGIAVSNLVDGFPVLRQIPFANYLFMDACTKLRDQILTEQKVKKRFPGILSDILNKESILSDDVLDMLTSDMLVAGIDTARKSLQWTILNLMLHDDIREKCINEIEHEIDNNEISLQNINQLHYLRAVVNETLRHSPPTAFAVPHKALQTTTIGKHEIPKNVTILINIHAIHMNSKIHKNPEVFIPERFLDSNGLYQNIDGYLPFGLGRRQCIGKNLAIQQLMYFTAKILINFDISKPLNTNISNLVTSKSGSEPNNFDVKISKRIL